MFEIVEILWGRKKLVFFVTLAMMIATYAVIRGVPSLYESRALIVVTNLQELGEGMQAPGVKFTSVMQQLKSRGNMAQLVRKYQLYPTLPDRDTVIATLEKAVVTDVKNREVQPMGPESVSISFRYMDKEVAQNVVNDMVSLFEQANKEMKGQAMGELSKLQQSIAEAEGRLKEIGSERDLAMLQSQAANRMANEAFAMNSQRMTVESTIESLKDKQLMIENQIGQVKRQIADQEKIINDTIRQGGPGNAAYGALLVRKADLEAQLNLYLTQYTEKNPKVITVREQLSEVSKQMARMATPDGGLALNTPEMVELRKMKLDLSRLETEKEIVARDLERKGQNLGQLSSGGASPRAMAGPVQMVQTVQPESVSSANRAEYDRLSVRYSRLMEQQDNLKRLSGMSGTVVPLFDVVDPASRPILPVAPKRILLLALAAALSMALGLLAAVIAELPKILVLRDERDIEYYLGAPVIALIPETVTPLETGRYRRLRFVRGVFMAVFFTALIPTLYFIINGTNIFQILGSR